MMDVERKEGHKDEGRDESDDGDSERSTQVFTQAEAIRRHGRYS